MHAPVPSSYKEKTSQVYYFQVYLYRSNFSLHQTFFLGNIPETLAEALLACSKRFFPSLHRLIAIFLTVPVTSATAERSFSTLRQIWRSNAILVEALTKSFWEWFLKKNFLHQLQHFSFLGQDTELKKINIISNANLLSEPSKHICVQRWDSHASLTWPQSWFTTTVWWTWTGWWISSTTSHAAWYCEKTIQSWLGKKNVVKSSTPTSIFLFRKSTMEMW